MRAQARGIRVSSSICFSALALFFGTSFLSGATSVEDLQLVTNAPANGTFYLLSAELEQPLPPYPYDPYEGVMPIFQLDGFPDSFLVADTPDDYVSLRSQQSLRPAGGLSFLSEELPPVPGEGGDTNEWCCAEIRPYGANDLWLEVTATNAGAGGVLASFTIHTPTNAAYDLFATTNLTTNVVGLNLTNWIWLGRSAAGVTNVEVEMLWPDMAFFQLGTLLDSDSDGLTDAYELLVSHTDEQDTDTDNDGIPDGWEVLHGLTPLVNDASDDPDGDDVSNAQEYFANSNPHDAMVVAWGEDSSGQCNVPSGLRGVVAVAAGEEHSLALRADGTVVAWGDNSLGETSVPGVTNATLISANGFRDSGWAASLALMQDGAVAQWGTTAGNPPANFTNGIAVAAGAYHYLGLRSNGTVVAWGDTNTSAARIPTNLPGVRTITAGWNHSVALLTNGAVVAWGSHQPDIGWTMTNVPPDLTNATAISALALHTVALRVDGSVTAWGYNQSGQTNVPAGLSNVTAVAAGGKFSLALKQVGTIAQWGEAPALPVGLSNVIALAAGWQHCLAIRTGRQLPTFVQAPADQAAPAGNTVSFSAKAAGLASMHYQWQFGGVSILGATNATLTLTNVQLADNGTYRLIACNGAGCVTSTPAMFTLVTPPMITAHSQPTRQWGVHRGNHTLSVAAAGPLESTFPLTYGWKFNGTNTFGATGSNHTIFLSEPQHEGVYTIGVTNVAGYTNFSWEFRVMTPGGVVSWGANDYGQLDRAADLTNVLAFAAGEFHSVAVNEDGSVTQWGQNWASVPADLTNAVNVAAGYDHTLALRSDGRVVAWGNSTNPATTVPTNLAGVQAIAAGWNHNVALLTNGAVTAWGVNGAVLGWNLTDVPAGLTNAKAIAAGALHSLALRDNGTVVAWGYNDVGQTNVPTGLTNVVAIAAGDQHNLALKEDGTVVAWGDNGEGQTSVPGGLSNVMAVAAGWAHSVALKNDGTVVVWGDNSEGQASVETNLTSVKMIAARGNHTLASVFSPLVQYPVDVSQDLLLIYNTNSADSRFVKDYYLAHRPRVSGANVLGIGGPTNDIYLPAEFVTNCALPVIDWLANNPTKHPNYVVLFAGIPERVNTNNTSGSNADGAVKPSTSVQLREAFTGVQPFVTHINMGDTNACKAYIDKLEFFGSNYSPGQVIISASALANTRFYLDDARNGPLFTNGVSGVLRCGIAASNITYVPAYSLYSEHIFNATNVAGYGSWGKNGQLVLTYALDGTIKFHGDSSWYIIATGESYNGQRFGYTQSKFIDWFSSGAFGGTNYSNTPIGAATHVDEPGGSGLENMDYFFGLWAANRNFAICAWKARITPFFQAVGDPFVVK